jgi:hypothetical protein
VKSASLYSYPNAASARIIAELYVLLGVTWILAGRHLAPPHAAETPAFTPHAHHTYYTPVSELLFVTGSALVLYFIVRASHRRIAAAHRAELASASRYRALLDTSVDAIHLLDIDGRLVEANRAFYRSLGRDPEHPPATLHVSEWDARLTPDELRAKISALLNHSEVFETVHRRRDGTLVEVEIGATGIELDDKRYLVCVARDLTGRRQFERAQLRAERLESLGLLAGGVAHDLNNALSPVILGAELLRARHPESPDDALLHSMVSAAKRGAGIIRQLLTFARGVEGERLPVPVRPLLAGLSHTAEETFPAGIRVELCLAPGLPPVRGDAAQLHQVLLSLVLNARDAMPGGGRLALGARPRLIDAAAAARIPGGRPGTYLELSVRDTGPGLSREARDHLFEPFFTTKPRGQGTGLGLSTALGIIRSHGGTIEHVAPPGGGAEFLVLLPAAEESTAPSPAHHAAASPRAPLLVGVGREILLVEDDALVREATRLLLERHGFRVRDAVDGEEALARLADGRASPALVLTDLMMPRLGGAEFARRVYATHPSLPLVAMTGLHADDPRAPDLRPLLAVGAVRELLVKPFNEAQLLAALARALRPEPKGVT